MDVKLQFFKALTRFIIANPAYESIEMLGSQAC